MPNAEPRKRKLDERYLRSLQKAEKDYLVHDTHMRGLAVRVRVSGNMTWVCIYRHHGRKRDYLIGNVKSIGLAQARLLANEVMYRVARGEDPAAQRAAQRGAGTFEELAQRYCAYAEKTNKSWQQGETLAKRYLLPRWAKLPAAAITRADVKTLMASISAPILANQVLAAAGARFSWAIKNDFGDVKMNPCVGVDRNKTNERERVLSDSELPLFWRAFDDAGLIDSSVLKMILLTGQRPTECCCMRSEHIVDGCWWNLPGPKVPSLGWPGTKNGLPNRVWLSPPALQIIREMENVGRVFPGARVARLGAAMRDICKVLRVNETVTPRDLRRTTGTTIASLEFGGRDAMDRILNHTKGGVGRVYDRHSYADENKLIMLAVADKIQSLISVS
jgi:integrase